jgi:hypothetical protein
MLALAGQLVWLTFVAFGGLLEPGYSEVRDAVSFLGARDAANPWVFDTAVAISGVSVIAVAAALALDGPAATRANSLAKSHGSTSPTAGPTSSAPPPCCSPSSPWPGDFTATSAGDAPICWPSARAWQV